MDQEYPSEIMLSAKDLSCCRDDRDLFVNLNFDIVGGEVVQIVGSNGSGKTTLLRILCGLMDDYSGDIEWCRQPMNQCGELYRAQLIHIGHNAGINPILTAEENLQWLLDIHGQGVADNRQIVEALARVGLSGYEGVETHRLSAGQKRRVSLARLYIEEAPIWILDEPFTAIDKEGVRELENLIFQHANRGGIVILTTHHSLQESASGLKQIILDDLSGIHEASVDDDGV